MQYPATPPAAETDDGEYDLASDPPRAETGDVPDESQIGAGSAPKPVAAVLSYRSAAPASSRAGLDTEKLTKQTAPLWILTGGLIVEALLAYLRGFADPTVTMVVLVFKVGIGTVLMTIGVLIAARVRQIQIGSLGSAVLRLAAVSVGTGAVADLLVPVAVIIPFGGWGCSSSTSSSTSRCSACFSISMKAIPGTASA